jgi:hypothetical protein
MTAAALSVGLLFLPATSSFAQDTPSPRAAIIDNTKMGVYSALAQLSFEALRRGDKVTAAKLAGILERVWDRIEGTGTDASLSRTDIQRYETIDHAMDDFIKPIFADGSASMDRAKIESAYHRFRDELDKAN